MQADNWDNYENSDEDSEEKFDDGRDGVILAISCRKSMFLLPDLARDEKKQISHVKHSLQCCLDFMKTKMIASTKDIVGVVFVETELRDKENTKFDHIFVYQPLDVLTVDRVINLQNLIDTIDDKFPYGHAPEGAFKIDKFFRCCNFLFRDSKIRMVVKRLFYFTDNDNPHRNNYEDKKRAIVLANDLTAAKIDVHLFNLNPINGLAFDVNAFYNELPDFECCMSVTGKMSEMTDRVHSRVYKRRPYVRIPFHIGPNLTMAVGVYNCIQKAVKPSPIRLARDSHEKVTVESEFVVKSTEENILTHDILRTMSTGSQTVSFDEEGLKKITNLNYLPGLELLGFKPMGFLKDFHTVDKCSFLYPDEEDITGSTKLYSALLDRCLGKNVLMLCRLVLTASSHPKVVVLLPQAQKTRNENKTLQFQVPTGFYVVTLPYADDFRNFELPVSSFDIKIDPEKLECMQKMIKALKTKYSITQFRNPALLNYWQAVEACAYNLDEKDELVDDTLPNFEAMTRRAGEILDQLKISIFGYSYIEPPNPSNSHRLQNANPKIKRTDVVKMDVPTAYQNNCLDQLTVAVLREYLLVYGIQVHGLKKLALIQAVKNHMFIKTEKK